MMELKILQTIGFEEKEAKIYLALLRLGSSPASKIANELGFDRTTVYYMMMRMLEKGFVSFLTTGNVKYFSALEPKQLNKLLKQREDLFLTIVPKLEKMQTKEEKELIVE